MVGERSQPKARQIDDQPTRSVPPGTLYIVSTPIGDLDDITIRAIRTLKTVSIIVSEDPSATQALLAHHHITGTVTSYGPRHLEEKVALLLHRLKKGHDVALVSDAGTPVIYDPGCRLIDAARHAGIRVKSVPGPSALTAAISVSGYSGDALLFEGHLPPLGHTLTTFLATLRNERRTLVFFAPIHTIKPVLTSLAKVFPTSRVTIAQDLTKPGEMILHGSPDMLLKKLRLPQQGSETTIVIEGASSAYRPKRPRKNTRPA